MNQSLSSAKYSPSSDSSNELSLYIHIPYCLQKCHYCDFVKFDVKELPPIDHYIKLLLKELKLNSKHHGKRLRTLYFGGGTPSLLNEKQLELILAKLHDSFDFSQDIEITLEANPGTLENNKIQNLLEMGINRFSLGVQTFNSPFLQACGRKHSTEESLSDLRNLSSLNTNFSADLLFGLPNQNLKHLKNDLETFKRFNIKHISPYNLTLPAKHFFNKERPSDELQVEMMHLIEDELSAINIKRYEVSNFSAPGFESKHNTVYWSDKTYLGLGMGAHSYLKEESNWGLRTWNTGNYQKYEECVNSSERKHKKFENLKLHEALTDFCHTSLRPLKGLSESHLNAKFNNNSKISKLVEKQLFLLENKGLVFYKLGHWALTSTGLEIPNEVFKELCFLEEDLKNV